MKNRKTMGALLIIVLMILAGCQENLTPPLLPVTGLSPARGAGTTDTTPALSWDAVPGAAGYEVQIAASEGGGWPIL